MGGGRGYEGDEDKLRGGYEFEKGNTGERVRREYACMC